jgi:hypothetical protein
MSNVEGKTLIIFLIRLRKAKPPFDIRYSAVRCSKHFLQPMDPAHHIDQNPEHPLYPIE